MSSPSRGSWGLAAALRGGALLLLVAVSVFQQDDPLPEGRLDLPERLRVSMDDVEAWGWRSLVLQAAEGPLLAVMTGDPPPVLVDPPHRLRADRASALRVRATEAVSVTLEGPADPPRTLTLDAGASDAFFLRPRSEGWTAWRLDARRGGALPGPVAERVRALPLEWSAWTEPPRSLRILALSGPPGSESQLAVRALEEAGEEVEVWTHLGRDLWIGRGDGEALPVDAAAYAGLDVILLFPGLELAPAEAAALVDAVRVGGTGLLLAATDGGATELLRIAPDPIGSRGWDTPGSVAGDALDWTVPTEILPLPPVDLMVGVRAALAEDSNPGTRADPPDGPDPAVVDPADPAPTLFLSALGRGRVGALALTDTWVWRMEAGAGDAHREFWRSLVDWLSDGFARDPELEILAGEVRTGEPVQVRWLERASHPGGSGPPTLVVSGPEGADVLVLPPLRETALGMVSTGAVVPFVPGGYHLAPADGDGQPRAEGVAFWALDTEAGTLDPAGRLARLAVASPGGGVEAPGAPIVPPGRGPVPGVSRSTLLFGVLAGLFLAEWALRRARGRP